MVALLRDIKKLVSSNILMLLSNKHIQSLKNKFKKDIFFINLFSYPDPDLLDPCRFGPDPDSIAIPSTWSNC